MTATEIKNRIKMILPKPFKVYVSKNGLTIQLDVDTNTVGGWDNANKLVYNMKKNLGIKLDEVGAGTDMTTMVRDWEFINCEVENTMISDANTALDAMKRFFKKYGNAYCSSPKAYDIIEKMRALVETDEN